MEQQFIELYEKALENKQFEDEGQNYQVNTLNVWASGQWEERCTNEYGSSLGGMASGNFTLTPEQKAFLVSKPGRHISIPLM